MTTRPTTDIPQWNPSESDVDIPDTAKQNLGWIYKEKVGYDRLNWFQKRVSTWLNWVVDTKETTEDIELTINSATDYDNLIEFLNSLQTNNYGISINPSSTFNPTYSKDLKFSGISGSGSISFPVTWEVNNLSIVDVSNRVSFSNLSVRKTPSDSIGLYLKNCPYVKFTTLECGISVTGFATQSDLRIKLENSFMETTNFTMTGDYTDLNNPYYFIHIDGRSRFEISVGGSCTITCNSSFSATRQYAVVKVDKGGYFESKITPTFNNWNNIFVCQIFSDTYDFDYAVNCTANNSTDAYKIETLLNNLDKVNSELNIDLGGYRVGSVDIELENVEGAGDLNITNLQIETDERFIAENINCNLYFTGVTIGSGSPTGAIYLSDVRYFKFTDEISSEITNGSNRAMSILNSRGEITGYTPTASNTQTNGVNHVFVTHNSNVVFKDIDTTTFDATMTAVILYNNSRVVVEKCTKPSDPKYVYAEMNDPGCMLIARDVSLVMQQYLEWDGVIAGNIERIY